MRRICIVAETVGSRGCKDLMNCAIPKYMYNIYIYIYTQSDIHIHEHLYIYIYVCIFRVYSRSQKAGNPIASNLKSNV